MNEKNQWFTPEIIDKLRQVIMGGWHVREKIYHHPVPECSILSYEGCKQLFHPEKGYLKFDVPVDVCCAQRINIREYFPNSFDHYCGRDFYLDDIGESSETLWVIAVDKDNKLRAIAPLFGTYTHTQQGFQITSDTSSHEKFVQELTDWGDNAQKELSPEVLEFIEKSKTMMQWLKKCCYQVA